MQTTVEKPNLSAANLARMNAALDKVYRFSDATESFRQRIERGVYGGAESAEVPRVQYNRHKWNRMDHRQQAEYERKMKETKTEYYLTYADDPECLSTVPKMVFEWFKSR